MAVIVVTVIPGKRPRATLHHEQKLIGSIVIQGPGRIYVESRGRKDCFKSIETCAYFCGIPTSEKIQLEWRAPVIPTKS
jgi:hypothetical protein